MPHSSGGGSHGGGSHGGSHGGHGGGSGRHTSHAQFPGSTRYVYYRDRQPVFVYSNYDITKKRSPARFLLLLFYAPFILVMIFGVGKSAINIPVKLMLDYDDEIIIDDRADVFSDEAALEDTLEEFCLFMSIYGRAHPIRNLWREVIPNKRLLRLIGNLVVQDIV